MELKMKVENNEEFTKFFNLIFKKQQLIQDQIVSSEEFEREPVVGYTAFEKKFYYDSGYEKGAYEYFKDTGILKFVGERKGFVAGTKYFHFEQDGNLIIMANIIPNEHKNIALDLTLRFDLQVLNWKSTKPYDVPELLRGIIPDYPIWYDIYTKEKKYEKALHNSQEMNKKWGKRLYTKEELEQLFAKDDTITLHYHGEEFQITGKDLKIFKEMVNAIPERKDK